MKRLFLLLLLFSVLMFGTFTATQQLPANAQQPPNQAPQVVALSCGSKATNLTLGESAHTTIGVDWNITDDNTPLDQLSYQWDTLTEPVTGSATICSPFSLVTDVAFSERGDYLFRLTVTDENGANNSNTVTVVVD